MVRCLFHDVLGAGLGARRCISAIQPGWIIPTSFNRPRRKDKIEFCPREIHHRAIRRHAPDLFTRAFPLAGLSRPNYSIALPTTPAGWISSRGFTGDLGRQANRSEVICVQLVHPGKASRVSLAIIEFVGYTPSESAFADEPFARVC